MISTLREIGIIPVIRAESADAALAVVEALVEAGLTVAEVTMTVPGAIDVIASVAKRFADQVLVGAGTVMDAETARRAVDAGAEFIVTPCLVPEVIDAARRADVAVLPGALTPTEVFEAFQKGGDMVKVFPAQNVGGAAYLRALRGPFPEIPLVPTGGVTLDNVREMFDAGAAAVGVGSELISKDALARRDYAAIGVLAAQFLAAARKARAR
ncbi:MAG TPA: bifunctional 4-hydroxy-2-oxoglutarate aldolase/2-dehydro-3-deoxy-phosphogluconate aldolase [Gemmatimonadaceae bacterium]